MAHLRPAAEAKNLATVRRETYLIRIVERARDENRLLVAYSNKELIDLHAITGVRVKQQYVNALTLAERDGGK